MAQAALMLAVNQYAYGQVGFQIYLFIIIDVELMFLSDACRLSLSKAGTSLSTLESFNLAPLRDLEAEEEHCTTVLALYHSFVSLYPSTHACIIPCLRLLLAIILVFNVHHVNPQ